MSINLFDPSTKCTKFGLKTNTVDTKTICSISFTVTTNIAINNNNNNRRRRRRRRRRGEKQTKKHLFVATQHEEKHL